MRHLAQKRDVTKIGQTSGTKKVVVEEPQQLVHLNDPMNQDNPNLPEDQIDGSRATTSPPIKSDYA